MSNESFAVLFSIEKDIFEKAEPMLIEMFRMWLQNDFISSRYCVFIEKTKLPKGYDELIRSKLIVYGQSIKDSSLKKYRNLPIITFQITNQTNEVANPQIINVRDLFDSDFTYTDLASRLSHREGFNEFKNNCPLLIAKMSYVEQTIKKDRLVVCFWTQRPYLDFLNILFSTYNLKSTAVCFFVGDGHLDDWRSLKRGDRPETERFNPSTIRQVKEESQRKLKEKKEKIYRYLSQRGIHVGPLFFKLVQNKTPDSFTDREYEALDYYKKSKRLFHDRVIWFAGCYKDSGKFKYKKSNDYDIDFADATRTALEADPRKLQSVSHAFFQRGHQIPDLDKLEKTIYNCDISYVEWAERDVTLEVLDI